MLPSTPPCKRTNHARQDSGDYGVGGCRNHGGGEGHEATDMIRAGIESKLRELVREPLELGVVDKEYSDKWSFFDSEYEAFVGGVRYAERAHNITNTSD